MPWSSISMRRRKALQATPALIFSNWHEREREGGGVRPDLECGSDIATAGREAEVRIRLEREYRALFPFQVILRFLLARFAIPSLPGIPGCEHVAHYEVSPLC